MKKKMLLTIIPALMVLSACAGAAPQKEAAPLFQEDTLAHEELFDDAEFVANKLGVKQPLRAASDMVEPQIGVQFKNYEKDSKNYCAIRYVGAIASRHVKAEWVRGVSRQDAYALKAKGIKESNVAYTSLSNNGTIIQAASGSCFVVYTLYDIPLFDEGGNQSCYWSYVAAGLKLTDLDNQVDPVMSKIVAVEIGRHHSFSFYESELNNKEYFVQGKVEGSATDVVVPLNDSEGNRAERTFDLVAGDNFGVFKWSATEFAFYGNHNCTYDSYYIGKSEKISTNYSLVGVSHKYTLYLNNDANAKYGLSPVGDPAISIPTTIYLNVKNTVWLSGNDNEAFAVWQTSKNEWVESTSSSDGLYKFDDVDTANAFIFARYDKTQSPNWDWGNQTDNINYLPGFVMNDIFTITGWNDGTNHRSGYNRSSSVE